MSFDIVCYNNDSPKNYTGKNLTQVTTLSGVLKEGTSITNPKILVELTSVPTFNYAYIQTFNRYYFCESPVNVNNKLWSIAMHCDVLKTYWNQIKYNDCIVSRNEFNRIYDLKDNEIWTTADSLYSILHWENSPFLSQTDNRFIMIVSGAGSGDNTAQIKVMYPLTSEYLITNEYYYDSNNNKMYNGISYNQTLQAFYIPANITEFYFTVNNLSGAYNPVNYKALFDVQTSQWSFTVVT